MYIVHMARLTASDARRHFFDLLDSAERGDPVVFERRGISFRLERDERSRDRQAVRRWLQVLDPALLDGEWSWTVDKSGALALQVGPDSE